MKEKLNPGFCSKVSKPGRYADGGNLYLFVKDAQRKSWVFRYVNLAGVRRDMGLGPYGANFVTLAKARALAGDARALLAEFKDPIMERKGEKQEARQAVANQLTFGQCAVRYIEANKAEWRNAKHTEQWSATLQTYAATMWNLPVTEVDLRGVLRCIEPHWTTKTETMTRVRQRIEAVLGWATVRGYRRGDNPARWKGHLDHLLPKPQKLKNVQHRSALPYAEVGSFMVALRTKTSLAARALELQILTATRPGEVCGATWDEFDLKTAVWTIPAERMKAQKEHTIPLPPQAVELLKQLPRFTGDFVFPGIRKGKPMTTAAGMKLLKELHPGITQHGFRSAFRDWAGETTAYPREVIEMAMAHQLKDKAEAAYARGNLIAKRKRLMDDWASFCDTLPADSASITPIRGAK